MKIWYLKDNGITTLTFWGHVTSSVTWPFDRGGRLPMGCPLWPCAYLVPLWRYGVSNAGRCSDERSGDFYTLLHCIGQTIN